MNFDIMNQVGAHGNSPRKEKGIALQNRGIGDRSDQHDQLTVRSRNKATAANWAFEIIMSSVPLPTFLDSDHRPWMPSGGPSCPPSGFRASVSRPRSSNGGLWSGWITRLFSRSDAANLQA